MRQHGFRFALPGFGLSWLRRRKLKGYELVAKADKSDRIDFQCGMQYGILYVGINYRPTTAGAQCSRTLCAARHPPNPTLSNQNLPPHATYRGNIHPTEAPNSKPPTPRTPNPKRPKPQTTEAKPGRRSLLLRSERAAGLSATARRPWRLKCPFRTARQR